MRLTRNGERLQQWSVKHKEALRMSEGDSFWRKREMEGCGVLRYEIETLQGMQAFLEHADVEKEAALIIAAEAMKQKMQYYKEEQTAEHKEIKALQGEAIPDYVYIF